MGGLKVVSEVLAKNISTFFTLEGQIGQLKQQVARMREMQTSDVWPEIASVQHFSDSYCRAINEVEVQLQKLESELADCGTALEASARALEEQDAATAAALRRLADRIGTTDATSTPTSTPATDPSVGTYY